MNIEIVSIGNELIFGRIVDSNSAYLSRVLSDEGLSVIFHSVVGDNPEQMSSVISAALKRTDLVITTGGLGPTKDDLTRDVISGLFNIDLVFNAELWEDIKSRFAKRIIKMPDNNMVQAMIPAGAAVIPNNTGTAPGFYIESDNKRIISLPGVPSEMKLMVNEWVIPQIKECLSGTQTKSGDAVFKTGKFTLIKDLKTYGLSESMLGNKIEHLMGPDKNPLIGTQASVNGIIVRLSAEADSKPEASELINDLQLKIEDALGDSVFGCDDDCMEDAVYRLLKEKKKTIALAESCTGGLVGNLLTNVSGISEYFLEGVVTYSNKAKTDILRVPENMIIENGAVSHDVAAAMAKGVRELSSSDIGIGITGIAGPTGGSEEKPVGLVYIAVDINGEVEVKQNIFSGDRKSVKTRAAFTALNMLRLRLL